MKKSSPGGGRLRKIESELQRVLAELIAREVKDPRVGNVTITGVSLAADMGAAKIFYAPFASAHPTRKCSAGSPAPPGSCVAKSGGGWDCATLRGWISCSMTPRRRPRASPVSSIAPSPSDRKDN